MLVFPQEAMRGVDGPPPPPPPLETVTNYNFFPSFIEM